MRNRYIIPAALLAAAMLAGLAGCRSAGSEATEGATTPVFQSSAHTVDLTGALSDSLPITDRHTLKLQAMLAPDGDGKFPSLTDFDSEQRQILHDVLLSLHDGFERAAVPAYTEAPGSSYAELTARLDGPDGLSHFVSVVFSAVSADVRIYENGKSERHLVSHKYYESTWTQTERIMNLLGVYYP